MVNDRVGDSVGEPMACRQHLDRVARRDDVRQAALHVRWAACALHVRWERVPLVHLAWNVALLLLHPAQQCWLVWLAR